MPERVKHGEVYSWSSPAYPDAVRVEITRVARDGSWADIDCISGYLWWRKRQPLIDGQLPFPCKRGEVDHA